MPTHGEVAVHAYSLWEKRGRPIGSPEVDWFGAESYLSLLERGGQVPEFREYVDAWAKDLQALRQSWLLAESGFLSFAHDRGIPVRGVITGEPGEFYADPVQTLSWCHTLSPFVVLRHDYHSRDFTVYVYKAQIR